MAQTQTSTAIVANMQTQERFFDHFEVEVWPGGLANPAFVKAGSTNVGTLPQTSTLTGGNTNNNTIVVCIFQGPTSVDGVTGVTDTEGNTYTKIAGATQHDGNNNGYYAYYAAVVTNGSGSNNVVTVAGSGGARVIAIEYSGVATVSPVDNSGGANQNGTGTLSYNISCSGTQDLIVSMAAFQGGGGTWSGLSGTLRTANGLTSIVFDQVVSSAGTQAVTQTSAAGPPAGFSIALLAGGAPIGNAPLLGPYNVAGKWVQASGAWIQEEPLYVKGLTTGTAYSYRSRVQIKSEGLPSAWTPFVQSTAGDTTPPSQSYSPSDQVTASGVVIQSNPVSPSSDTDHYEFYTNNTGSTPSSSQAPNLPSSNDGSVRLILGDLDTASVWIRGVDTSGNRQVWTLLGVFNSNGALILSTYGAAGSNLVTNPSFEKATATYPTGLQSGTGQYLADGWVAYIASASQFKLEVENGGPNPRTGQKNGHIQLSQSKAIASGTTVAAILISPGDTPNPGRNKLIPVRGGDYYYFGGWARWDAGLTLPGGVSGLVNFNLTFYDSNSNFVSSAASLTSVTSASGGYQFLNGTVVVPSTAAFMQLQCNAQITTTGAIFNTGTSGIYMDARFEDVFIYKAIRSVHGSYRPLTNPLTGHDAGSNATVNIASFTLRCGSTDLSVSSGSVTSLSYNTLYYIYFDDPDFVGGSENFNATTTKETALQGEFRYFIGSIQTPRQGAPDTVGNNDGGATSQTGMLTILSMNLAQTSISGNARNLNISNSIDGDLTTSCTMQASGNNSLNDAQLLFSGIPGIYRRYSSLTLKMRYKVSVNTVGPATGRQVFEAFYNIGPGQTQFVSLFENQGTVPPTTAVVSLPATINPATVTVLVNAITNIGDTLGVVSADVFEVWMEAVE